MDAGDGEVERNLLVGLERQVGQVERLAVDPVPVLLVARAGARVRTGMPSSRNSRLSRSKAWRRAECSVGVTGDLDARWRRASAAGAYRAAPAPDR